MLLSGTTICDLFECLSNKSQIYKRQNKMFRFYKTFCSEFSIVNTKQNVHFATKKIEATYSVAFKL